MRAAIRKVGNSAGIIIPKALLHEAGVAAGDALNITTEEGRIVLAPIRRRPRTGWADAAQRLAEGGEDALVWPEFGNDGDDLIEW